MKKLITLTGVKKVYTIGTEKYEALKGIDMEIEEGEFVSIMGPSGSGKSTMLHILGCLDVPSIGSYWLAGENVGKLSDKELSVIRNQKIGFVFQNFNLLPKLSVYDNVILPFLYSKINKKARKQAAIDALESVGLADKIHNKPNQLSGGQVQRVAIARSLVVEPQIILADEPTGNLDTKTGEEVLDIFKKINDQGRTVILITHEPEIAEKTKRTILIRDGLIEQSK